MSKLLKVSLILVGVGVLLTWPSILTLLVCGALVIVAVAG